MRMGNAHLPPLHARIGSENTTAAGQSIEEDLSIVYPFSDACYAEQLGLKGSDLDNPEKISDA